MAELREPGWGSRDWLVVLCFGLSSCPCQLPWFPWLSPIQSRIHGSRAAISLECQPPGFLPRLHQFSHFNLPSPPPQPLTPLPIAVSLPPPPTCPPRLLPPLSPADLVFLLYYFCFALSPS